MSPLDIERRYKKALAFASVYSAASRVSGRGSLCLLHQAYGHVAEAIRSLANLNQKKGGRDPAARGFLEAWLHVLDLLEDRAADGEWPPGKASRGCVCAGMYDVKYSFPAGYSPGDDLVDLMSGLLGGLPGVMEAAAVAGAGEGSADYSVSLEAPGKRPQTFVPADGQNTAQAVCTYLEYFRDTPCDPKSYPDACRYESQQVAAIEELGCPMR